MKGFNTFRAKDPVLAVILSMGLVFAAPAISKAQQAGWEEVGPAGQSAQQLMSSPPRVVAPALGQTSYRPPVEPPVNVAASNVAAAVASVTPQSHYVVQAGDTLPKIAMKVFGDANRWQDLMVLNNIENGNRIFVGQKLVTAASNSSAAPVAQVAANIQQQAASHLQHTQQNFSGSAQNAQQQFANVAQQTRQPADNFVQQANNIGENAYEVAANIIEETAESSVSADADADASFYGQTGGSYTVKSGDTLGIIAKRLLGSSKKWREIARANPSINPNRLMVGETIVIPGAAPTQHEMSVPTVEARPLSSQPWQSAMAAPAPQYQQPQPQTMSAPSFDPPPLMAPPPPPPPAANYAPYGSPAPAAMQNYAPPAAPPVYSGSGMTPPPPPVSVPNIMEPPAAPYMAAPVPPPTPAPGNPVAISTRELYREERFRIPDELKPTDFTPYFVNLNGYHGLFETECALLPYLSTWNFGVQMKYENYRYLNGEKDIDESYELIVPVHLTYAGKKFFAGLTIPFQNWEVKDGVNTADLSGLQDPSLKLGYQVWKNLDGDHAVTVHAEGRFPGGNYNRPQLEISTADGDTKTGSVLGPTGASRGAEVQVGAAYSGRLNDRWASHLNMALANNPEDTLTKFILRGGIDYRVNRNFAIVGELNSVSYDIDNDDQDIYSSAPAVGKFNNETSGTNVDMVIGFTLFNDNWQGNLAFPIALQKEFGYGHDFGVIFGVNHRWD